MDPITERQLTDVIRRLDDETRERRQESDRKRQKEAHENWENKTPEQKRKTNIIYYTICGIIATIIAIYIALRQ